MRVAPVNKAWLTPTLQNGWVAYDTNPLPASWGTLQYIKDPSGFVHLRGLIKSGTVTPGTVITNLPAGYRPGSSILFPQWTFQTAAPNEVMCRIDIFETGNIVAQYNVQNGWLSLNGISFLAEL